ncbi:MAG: Trm112 family protein [Terriglobales bacterium]|jgi:uncharacterized protein YbaR (Trm112 family)
MISQDLLDVLVCPVCRKPLVLGVDAAVNAGANVGVNGGANGESLKCGQCRRVYPIQDGIPIMLVDAAAIDPA